MKLLRRDLAAGIEDRLFEIPGNNIQTKEIRFLKDIIECRLTSKIISKGFKLHGDLKIPFLVVCDRCLVEYPENQDCEFELLLVSDESLIVETVNDVIIFPENLNEIDLTSTIRDWVILNKPIKNSCKPDCKGLCIHCGANMNICPCNCSNEHDESPWAKLKK